MTLKVARSTTMGLLALLALGGCSASTPENTTPVPIAGGPAGAGSDAETDPTDFNRLPHTKADVAFMTDMIRHHAQAVLIAGWAPNHGASGAIQRMSERIVVGQEDETALMERWLRDAGEPVPGGDTSHQMGAGTDHAGMDHSGMDHSASMPGMLTAEELARLDQARGPEFDRLFLTYMIKHHQGALTMVDQLFSSPGAAQDEGVFRLASDVYADQSSEVTRMQRMLAALPPEGENP